MHHGIRSGLGELQAAIAPELPGALAERVAGLIPALKTASRSEVQVLRCARSAIERRGRHLQGPRFVRFPGLQVGHQQGPAGTVVPLFPGFCCCLARIIVAEGPLNGWARRFHHSGPGRRLSVGAISAGILKLEAAAHREPLAVTEAQEAGQVGGGKLAQADRHVPAHPLSCPAPLHCSSSSPEPPLLSPPV